MCRRDAMERESCGWGDGAESCDVGMVDDRDSEDAAESNVTDYVYEGFWRSGEVFRGFGKKRIPQLVR